MPPLKYSSESSLAVIVPPRTPPLVNHTCCVYSSAITRFVIPVRRLNATAAGRPHLSRSFAHNCSPLAVIAVARVPLLVDWSTTPTASTRLAHHLLPPPSVEHDRSPPVADLFLRMPSLVDHTRHVRSSAVALSPHPNQQLLTHLPTLPRPFERHHLSSQSLGSFRLGAGLILACEYSDDASIPADSGTFGHRIPSHCIYTRL